MSIVIDKDLRVILEKGVLAPSGDNLQPWLFDLHDNVIELYVDPRRHVCFWDEGHRAPYISSGAVIENMRVAATHLGYALSVDYFPRSEDPLCVARITYTPSHVQGHFHYAYLGQRVTNRKFYKRASAVDPLLLEDLKRLIPETNPTRLMWMEASDPSYRSLARLVGVADQIRFQNQKIHMELIKGVRLTQKEVEATRDGLDVKTLELGPAGASSFRVMASWKRMRVLNALGFGRFFNFFAKRQIHSSCAMGMIVAPTLDPVHFVKGGETLERVWLEMTRQNIALQPMSAIPIFLVNEVLNQGKDFSGAQNTQLQSLYKEFYALWDLDPQDGVIFLFRIGRAGPPSATSLRRPLDTFFKKNTTDP